jgi:hypothetical protein
MKAPGNQECVELLGVRSKFLVVVPPAEKAQSYWAHLILRLELMVVPQAL